MSLAEPLSLPETWPPRVAEAEIRALNALYRRRGRLNFRLAGADALLEIGAEDAPLAVDGPAFRVSLGETVFDLRVPAALVDELLRPLDVTGRLDRLDRLDSEAAALLIEFALADAFGRLEAALGEQVSVLARNDATFLIRAHRAQATLELGGARHRIALWFDDAAAIRLGRALDRLAQPADLFDLPQTVRICMGWREIAVADLRDLSIGDVILVESGRGNSGPVAIVGDRLAARLSVERGRLSAAARFAPLRGTNWEWTMEASAGAAPRPEGLDEAEIDQLPVKIVFELGRVEMPLGEVRGVGAGAVIPLARALDEAVDIVANGRRIGRGSIVRIGDAVGIRVERLTADG